MGQGQTVHKTTISIEIKTEKQKRSYIDRQTKSETEDYNQFIFTNSIVVLLELVPAFSLLGGEGNPKGADGPEEEVRRHDRIVEVAHGGIVLRMHNLVLKDIKVGEPLPRLYHTV